MLEGREGPGWGAAIRTRSACLVALGALAAVVGGLVLWAAGEPTVADVCWAAATALLLVPLTVSVLRSLLRGDVGVDAIALVSMAGALALGEYLAGAVVALMLAGGNALEETANRRARRELTSLVERAPRSALVRRDHDLLEVPVEAVVPGDHLLVRAGEVVPVDGMMESDEAIVDESALTGEPLRHRCRRASPRSEIAVGSVVVAVYIASNALSSLGRSLLARAGPDLRQARSRRRCDRFARSPGQRRRASTR